MSPINTNGQHTVASLQSRRKSGSYLRCAAFIIQLRFLFVPSTLIFSLLALMKQIGALQKKLWIKTDVKSGDSRLGAPALPVCSQDLMLHYYAQGPTNVVEILNSYFCELEFEPSYQNTP